MIQIKGLNKSYGAVEVLKDINLSISPKETIVICGPSGSGKSTLIKSINTLESYQAGQIFLNGHDIATITPTSVAKTIGMVFQDFGLFQNKTVLENLVAPLVIVHKQDREDATLRSTVQLAKLGLRDHMRKYPHQLSGGQKQRVAICRALVVEPQFLLYDEPTSALDPEMVGSVLEVIEGLAHTGMGQVIVTHEMSFAKRVADRVVFMDAGRIVEVSKSEEFFANPKSERARAFLSKVMR